MFKAFVILCLTFPKICFGSCWSDIYTDKQTDVYLDYCSIVQVGKYKKAWVRWVYAENKQTIESPIKEYDETKDLTYYDCALRASAIVDVIYYSPEPEDKVVNRVNVKFKSSELRDVVPDSLGESVLDAVCKSKSRK